MTSARALSESPPLRLGTRASLLATTQSGHVAEALRLATGHEVELVPITTAGDVLTGPLAQLGGTGVFVAALREALLRGECDLVVHSMKDLPTGDVAGLTIGAVPPRASVRDVLCARDGMTLADLPRGAVVGSGSPRRIAQVLRRRPDLHIRGIRGNVDTRLRKVDEGEYDAIVLAEAGLSRIGRTGHITERFDADEWPASAGQGALAVEVHVDSPFVAEVASISDVDAEVTALWERAVLRRLEAGCAAPVGISARHAGEIGSSEASISPNGRARVSLVAEVYAPDGAQTVRVRHTVDARELTSSAGRDAAAAAVVAALMERGAGALADLGPRPAGQTP